MIHLNIGSNLNSKHGSRFDNISLATNLLINSKIKIKCPVHLLHGGQDADVPIETSLKIMELIESDDVKLTIVKSANHQFSEQKNLKLIFNSINEMIN